MSARKAKKSLESAAKIESVAVAEKKPVVKTKAVKKPAPAKAKSAAKSVSMGNVKSDSYIVIDHPVQGEMVSGLHYAVRVGASPEGHAEIAFDDGEWIPCRFASGYWWYDWGYFAPGNHDLTARLIDENGKVILISETVTVNIV